MHCSIAALNSFLFRGLFRNTLPLKDDIYIFSKDCLFRVQIIPKIFGNWLIWTSCPISVGKRTIFETTTFGIVFFLTDPQPTAATSFYHLLFFMLRYGLKFIYWDGGENFFGSSTSQRLGVFLKRYKRWGKSPVKTLSNSGSFVQETKENFSKPFRSGFYVINSTLLPLSWRMLGLNPGLLPLV